MKYKIFILLLIFLFNIGNVFAISSVSSGKIEKTQNQIKQLNKHSLDLRKIAKEASLELKAEEQKIMGDLRVLWQHAVENSETIKFAIYKLSDPNGEKKRDQSKIKKLLKPIASIAPFAAAASGSPVASGSTLLGGNVLKGILSEDSYNKELEKVTDADLVILAKAIEDLQNELVITYYEYVAAKRVLAMADLNLKNRELFWESAKDAADKNTVIADTFYREALAKQHKAQENLLLKRAALEQLVGNDAILIIENKNSN